MINDTELIQESGNNSLNLQAKEIKIVNEGLSYTEAKEIALDVYKANFLELSNKASEIAFKQTKKFTEDFLEKLYSDTDVLKEELEKPSFQMQLFKAQKENVKANDDTVEKILSSILIERAKQKERTLKQIALEESITTVSKLTNNQLDLLSLSYLVKDHTTYIHFSKNPLDALKYFLKTIVQFSIVIEDFESPDIAHLVFCGCIRKIEKSLLNKSFHEEYEGLFTKGFSMEVYRDNFDTKIFDELIIPCITDHDKFQFNYIHGKYELQRKLNELSEDTDLNKKVFSFAFKYCRKNYMEVPSLLKEINPDVGALFDIKNTQFYEYELTPVGVALGLTNFGNKTGFKNPPWPYRLDKYLNN